LANFPHYFDPSMSKEVQTCKLLIFES